MNQKAWGSFLDEAMLPNDRVEKQLAALRLKRARQNIPSSPEFPQKEIPKENPILKTNFDLIYKHIASNGNPERRKVAQRAITSVYANGLLNKTPLAELILKSFLGAGSFSAAFEDNDGHVIKCGGVRDGQSEQDFYNDFLKNPSKDFIVHYYKTFPIPSDPSKKLYIAITNKFLTFFEYAQFHQGTNMVPDLTWPDKYYDLFAGNREHKGKLWKIREHMIKRKIEMTPKNILATWGTYEPQQITHDIGDLKKELEEHFGISYKDSTKIFQQILQAFCSQTRPDVHLNNLGVNITSGMDNPNFFFFDR